MSDANDGNLRTKTAVNTTERFETWAIVEVMGHKRFAGRVTEQEVGGASFVRVDVPKVGEREAFTKLFGASSIYCITPCDEETAHRCAEGFHTEAFNRFELPALPAASSLRPDPYDPDDLIC